MAARVVAVECEPGLAALAERTLAEHRPRLPHDVTVTVLAKPSTELVVAGGRDQTIGVIEGLGHALRYGMRAVQTRSAARLTGCCQWPSTRRDDTLENSFPA